MEREGEIEIKAHRQKRRWRAQVVHWYSGNSSHLHWLLTYRNANRALFREPNVTPLTMW